ncbi:MAG: methylthioribulose-1-phosphate dehydratase [Alteromonadaceae bacterium]
MIKQHEAAEQLADTGVWLAQRNWVPATGGNFSIRLASEQCLISASGKDKGKLTADDCLHIQWQGNQLTCQGKPSDETLLHTRVYDLDSNAGAVLHTHSVAATVLGRLCSAQHIEFNGYEMQKSITGQRSHEQTLLLPVMDNNQDITALAQSLESRYKDEVFNYAFLVRGHGLYVWGNDLTMAKRHIEGWEFLMACELERLRIGQPYVS